MGYLQVRDPVVVNVSYFFHFLDDPTLHYTACNSNISSNISSNVSSSAKVNVQRGAALLYSTAEFRKMVCTGQLTAEVIGSKTRGNQAPLCSVAYKYMFNSCRVPQRQQDAYRMYDPSQHTHSIVSRKGYFFSIELVDGESQDPLPIEVLEAQLERCIEMADDLSCVGASDMASDMALDVTSDMASGMTLSLSPRAKLGLLTSQNRDDWADGRQQLLDIGGDAFGKDLERLESGAILLNLDDHSPVSRQECGEMCWTGGMKGGHNRWFDKSIQVCVSENGKSGFLGEHSMMDGMPCVRYADYITGVTYAEAKRRSHAKYGTEAGASSSLMMDVSSMVNELFGEILSSTHGGPNGVANGANSASSDSKMIVDLVDVAQASFHGLIKSHDLHVQSFHGYGSGWMKQNGFSPDAFVQAAMQVASFRLFGEMVGTYEATQVRRFLHGRTETTRTVSRSMETFVKMMGPRATLARVNAFQSVKIKKALKVAVADHNKYMRKAGRAQGVDRHLLGLSMMVKAHESVPALMSNELFARAKRWRMSTSQLSHPRFALWGYGEVVPDGVGLAYSIHAKSCVFCVTALKHLEWTDKLSELLEEALLEMKIILEATAAAKPVSKL